MTMITATYPLTGLSSEPASTIAATRPRPWGFWATLGWLGVAVVAFFAAAFVGGIGLGRFATRSGSGNRAHGGGAIFQARQDFGRRAQDVE